MSDEPRSAETRARAESALVRLLHELGDDEPFLVVLGGLVPEVLTRDEQGAAIKDYYDFAYVLLHNRAGDPEEAAARLLVGPLADELTGLRSTFVEVRERYGRPADIGAQSYAEQAAQVDPVADGALLRADAVDAVQRFFAALGL